VEKALDETPDIGPRPLLFKLWDIPPLLRLLKRLPLIRGMVLKLSFDRLALGYDVARGFIQAQNGIGDLIDRLAPTKDADKVVRAEIHLNKTETYDRIEQLRCTFPEVITTLQTIAASRSLLNRQRKVINHLVNSGLLDTAEADSMLRQVDHRQQQLESTPIHIKVPEPEVFLKQVIWLDNVAPKVYDRMLSAMEPRLYSTGDYIRTPGLDDGSLTLIFRGSVEVHDQRPGGEKRVDILGPGTVLGIRALLNDSREERAVQARGLVETLWFDGNTMHELIAEEPTLARNLRGLKAEYFADPASLPEQEKG